MEPARRRFHPQLSHQLLALGMGGVIITAGVLLGVGAWQSDRFADKTGAT